MLMNSDRILQFSQIIDCLISANMNTILYNDIYIYIGHKHVNYRVVPMQLKNNLVVVPTP